MIERSIQLFLLLLFTVSKLIDAGSFSLTGLTASQGSIVTGQSSSYSGFSVAIGDLTGDGVPDVVIGGPNYGSGPPGRVYLVAGGTGLASTISLPSSFTIDGMSNNEIGFSLAIVDYNNDGQNDLLIAGFLSSSSINQVTYAIPGPISSNLDLSSSSPITFTAQSSNSYWSGFSVSSAGTIGGKKGFLLAGGQVWLVYSSNSLTSFQLPTTLGSGGVVFTTSNSATFNVAGGTDINGDNVPDILMGNRAYSSNAGIVYLVYGATNLADTNLDSGLSTTGSSAGIKISAVNSGDQLGSSVAFLGDFNGDGNNDFAIGAPYASGGSGFGKVYIIFGLASGATYTSISLSSLGSGGVIFTGSTGHFGNSITSVNDISSDGKCEILIGNAAGGTAYLIYGTANTATVATSTIAGGGYGFEITGATQSSLATFYTSSSVASGSDIYDDGEVAVVIGASGSSSNAGVTYVVKGSALFVSPSQTSSQPSSQLTTQEFHSESTNDGRASGS
eukprot:gene15447-17285_t